MTDKTIIDGVDVSGCEYLKDNECRCDMQCYHIEDGKCITEPEMVKRESLATYGTCSLNPDCYFKQSARKDERIKSLQGELWAEKKILTELDQENAELKEHDSESWKNVASTYKVEYRKAEEKLSQIAELADLIVNDDDDKPACVHDKDCPLNGGDGFDNHCNTTCPFIIAQQIKQITQGE